MLRCDERNWGGPTSTRVSSGHVRTCGPGNGKNAAMKVEDRDLGKNAAMEVEDRDLTKLLKLLNVFPAFSLEAIAQAYTDAESDVNVAAELLATRLAGLNGVQEARADSHAEWESVDSRQSAEHPADDLLLEKYGRRVGELINRGSETQRNSLLQNVQSALDGASQHNARDWYGSTAHGDNRNSLEEDRYGAPGDCRKKTKQKGRGGLDNQVEMSRQAGEDFLVSMLGENSELGIAVVRDVLDSLEGDTQKILQVYGSLEVLLQMVPQSHNVDSTFNQDGSYFDDKKLDGRIQSHYQWTEPHMDKAPSQTSMKYQVAMKDLKEWFPNSYEGYLLQVLQNHNFKLSDAVQFILDKNPTECITSPLVSKAGVGNNSRSFKSNAPKQNDSPATRPPPLQATWTDVKPAAPRPPPLKATWTDVKRTIVPLQQTWKETPSEGKKGLTQFKPQGGVNDYERNRLAAQEHWRLMSYYFKEAAAAYERGERSRAGTLAEKGKHLKKLAQEADGRASQHLFQSRNQKFNNNITIDLHGLHVGEAINVLKRHLQTLCSIPSVYMLTVITGYGSHSVDGRAKIKPAVTGYLSRKGIAWEEANGGCLTIKMTDVQNKGLEFGVEE